MIATDKRDDLLLFLCRKYGHTETRRNNSVRGSCFPSDKPKSEEVK